MWYQVQTTIGKTQQFLTHMDRQQWIVVFVVVVIFGAFCMRGFGSRVNY